MLVLDAAGIAIGNRIRGVGTLLVYGPLMFAVSRAALELQIATVPVRTFNRRRAYAAASASQD